MLTIVLIVIGYAEYVRRDNLQRSELKAVEQEAEAVHGQEEEQLEQEAEVKPITKPIVKTPKQEAPINIVKEPVVESNEDSALIIEKCKVNSDQIAKGIAEDAKQNYLTQRANSGACSFPESQNTIDSRAFMNRKINEYKVELNAAEASGHYLDTLEAKTNLLNAETALMQLESSLWAQATDCLNRVTADSEDFYREAYQQQYDTTYQQCING